MDHEMLDARVAFYTCLDKKLNNKKDGLLVDAKEVKGLGRYQGFMPGTIAARQRRRFELATR